MGIILWFLVFYKVFSLCLDVSFFGFVLILERVIFIFEYIYLGFDVIVLLSVLFILVVIEL